MEFTLKFNNNESTYTMEDVLGLDGNRWLRFAIKSGGNFGKFYRNNKTKEKLREVDNYGSLYLVSMNFEEPKWKLTNENKKIGNFICYKANSILTKRTNKGEIKQQVTAWYTREIPVAFGPIGYGNLPGLIVDLQIGGHRYFLKSLTLNPKKEIKINRLKKGEKISENEYIDIGISVVNGLRN